MKTKFEFSESEASLRNAIYELLREDISVFEDGYMFARAYKSGYWDGKVHFIDEKNDEFPTGLLELVTASLYKLQEGIPFQFEIEYDKPDRFINLEDLPKEIKLKDGDSEITLRDYQYNAVRSIIDNEIGIINASTNSGKCVVKETALLTATGYKTIDQIFFECGIELDTNEREIPNEFDFSLINMNGEKERPSHFTVNGVKDVLRITLKNGIQETVTLNHPLLTFNANAETHYNWVVAGKLNLSDHLVMPVGPKFAPYGNFANYLRALPEFNPTEDCLVPIQIQSIEYLGQQPTYDVCMPKTHSFIGNGIINHNTEVGSGIIQQLLPYLERGETIAFFTHSKQIFNQSAERISERLGIKVGKFGNGKKDIRQVNVVMIPTINVALSADPEAGLKLTEKERITKRIAKEISPKFDKNFGQRMALQNFIKNFPIKTKVDQKVKDILEDIFYSCGTDKEVQLTFRNYKADYENILMAKNGKILKKREEALDFMKSVVVMIVDEAHHTSSDSWYKSLLMCENAQYRVALTGSIDKTNKVLWRRMQGLFQDITIKTTNKEMIERGFSAKPTVTMIPITNPGGLAHIKDYLEVYKKGIVENMYRNTVIARLTAKQYEQGKGILLIVNWVEHGTYLSDMLKELNVPHEFVHGEMDDVEREKHLENMKNGNLKVMIATSIMDEGVDISGIDVLVLCASGKSLRQVLQRVGRALRKKKTGENVATVFDFDDKINPYLLAHSKARKDIYKEQEFELRELNG